MFTAAQLQKRPAAFQRLTGVTPEEFNTITEAFEPLWDEAETTRLNNRKRKRAIGAGLNFKLEVTAQILMTLIYLRQYVTQELLRIWYEITSRFPEEPRALQRCASRRNTKIICSAILSDSHLHFRSSTSLQICHFSVRHVVLTPSGRFKF
jgi:hypothetical protein